MKQRQITSKTVSLNKKNHANEKLTPIHKQHQFPFNFCFQIKLNVGSLSPSQVCYYWHCPSLLHPHIVCALHMSSGPSTCQHHLCPPHIICTLHKLSVPWALISAPLIPARFQSFPQIPVPFQCNSPAKISKYWYSGTYTITVPGMDQNRMALECMTTMDAKNWQIWQVLHVHMKNSNKIRKKIREGAHYWWLYWGTDYMVCAHF